MAKIIYLHKRLWKMITKKESKYLKGNFGLFTYRPNGTKKLKKIYFIEIKK